MHRRAALLIALLASALSACGAFPAPAPIPTATVIRANLPPATTAAPLEGTATRTPRPPKPTRTPTSALPFAPLSAASLSPTIASALPFQVITATPSRTRVPPTAADTALPPQELDCQLVWQSPSIGATMLADDKFGAGWNIRNTGTATWEPGSFQFTYLGGYRLSHDFEEPLTQSVAPGDEVVLSVPMKVPSQSNLYTTHWGLRSGDRFFCRLTVTIWVTTP
jgi:hypothetical protein